MILLKSFIKFLGHFKVLFIYIFIFSILYSFLKINNFSFENFSKIIFPYFGMFTYLLFGDIVFDIFFSFIERDKYVLFAYRTRLLFFNIFLVTIAFLTLIIYVNTFSELNSFNILFTSLNTFKLGYIFTESSLYLFENFRISVVASLAFLIGIASFFISGVTVFIRFIKSTKKSSLSIKSLEERQEDLQNKIEIKEALIKDEQKEFKNYNKAQDIGIREQLARARNKNFKRQVTK